MSEGLGALGLGIGRRPELALAIDRHPGLGFVELTAENHDPRRPAPEAVQRLLERGVRAVVHARQVDPAALDLLEKLAARVEVPGAMPERDDAFPPAEELAAELEAIRAAVARGAARRAAAV